MVPNPEALSIPANGHPTGFAEQPEAGSGREDHLALVRIFGADGLKYGCQIPG
jgi:hypothetical protein